MFQNFQASEFALHTIITCKNRANLSVHPESDNPENPKGTASHIDFENKRTLPQLLAYRQKKIKEIFPLAPTKP